MENTSNIVNYSHWIWQSFIRILSFLVLACQLWRYHASVANPGVAFFLRYSNLPLNAQVFSLPPDVVGRGEDFFVLNVTERETIFHWDHRFQWEYLLCRRDCQTHWCSGRWSWGCCTDNLLQSSSQDRWSGCSWDNQWWSLSGQN